jgi:type III secretion system low calcium response chaperone LcrH/SycD
MDNTSTTAVQPEQLAEQIAELLLHGGTLGSVYDYNDQDYEVLYALGHSLYAQGRYLDAMKAFGFLVMHNHLERRFMNAFASSLQMIKSYEEAIKYYTMASVMDMTDPAPTFHTCECMIALGMVQEAREGLPMVIGQCTEAKHGPLKERAQALLDLLNKQTATH